MRKANIHSVDPAGHHLLNVKRAFTRKWDFGDIPHRRAEIRMGMRYALQTDIKGFYPSIYTHSISWALHTKAKSQDNVGFDALLGNRLDRVIQNSQTKQTKGIPIGPDTSFLAAELILTKLDRLLHKEVTTRFFRYMDDYEFAFRSFNEAEQALSTFQELLAGFELSANEGKTRIIELPSPIQEPWPRELREFDIAGPSKSKHQSTKLLDFFDLALRLRVDFPDQGVISYATS